LLFYSFFKNTAWNGGRLYFFPPFLVFFFPDFWLDVVGDCEIPFLGFGEACFFAHPLSWLPFVARLPRAVPLPFFSFLLFVGVSCM